MTVMTVSTTEVTAAPSKFKEELAGGCVHAPALPATPTRATTL